MQGTARHAHDHATDLDTTLDFVNTLEYCSTRTHEEYGGVHEALRTPADAFSWLLERHLLHEDKAPPADDWAALGRVREVRAAFRELVDASVEERTPTPESIETVNELLGSRQVPAIEATADGVRLSHRHIAPPVERALDEMCRLLKPNGILYLTTGNARPFRDCLLAWRYVIPEIHVGFFEPRSLETALTRTGFRPVYRVRPRGYADILRFKILKNLGIRKRSLLERAVPWKLVSFLADLRYQVTYQPYGVAVPE